jgi:hypothetical protein
VLDVVPDMDSRTKRHRSSGSPALRPDPADRRASRRDTRSGERLTTPWVVRSDAAAITASAAALDRLDARIRTLCDSLADADRQDADRIVRLRLLCERLADRNREIQALVGRVERLRYHWMAQRLRRLIDRLTPRGATVAVVSHGDGQLTAVAGRHGWHLPAAAPHAVADDPIDSEAAIAQVEQLRLRGARYLVIPRTALWWLDRYRGLDEHLRRSATCMFHDVRTGALFALGAALTRP